MQILEIRNIIFIEKIENSAIFHKIILEKVSPKPQSIKFNQHWNKFSDSYSIIWSGDEIIKKFIDEFVDELSIRCIKKPVTIKNNRNNTSNIDVADTRSNDFIEHEEGYNLIISKEGIRIEGKTYKGIYYGIQTIYQLLLKVNDEYVLPCCDIKDYPIMEIRSLSDDISRGQVTNIESVKRYIKKLSRFKLNSYMFYIEDTFKFKKYPTIGANRGALTLNEINEIQEYGINHCVEVSPIFQTIGHMETYFWNPKFWEFSEFPGSACLNPANPKALEFIDDLIQEVSATFNSPCFHIGCDESREIGWVGSKDKVKEVGMGKLYLEHYSWVINRLKELGKTRIFLYSDIAAKYKEVLNGLPKEDAIFVMWDYGLNDHYKRMDPVIDAKLPFIVSSSALNWGKPFPDNDMAMKTNKRLIEEGLKYGAFGQICSTWGDNGNEDLHENRLYCWAAAASMSWNLNDFDEKTFDRAFFIEMLGFYNLELNKIWELMGDIPRIMGESQIYNEFYAHLWRHPFAERIHGDETFDPRGMEYAFDYKEGAKKHFKQIFKLIDKIKSDIPSMNKSADVNLLDYIKYGAEIELLFINKIQATKKIEQITQTDEHYLKNKTLSLEELDKCKQILLPLIDKFKELKLEYSKLWLNCSKRPRLDKIIRYFDWMIFWYEEKIGQLENQVLFKHPYLLGDWIFYKVDGWKKTSDYRYFKKEFLISDNEFDKILKVSIQMIPSDFGTLFINGTKLGSAPDYSKSTNLSLDTREIFVELDKDKLNKGVNTIHAEAIVFKSGFPMVNFFMLIKYEDGKERVLFSDTTWKGSKNLEGPWTKVSSKGKAPDYMGGVYNPNFKRGWSSMFSLGRFGRIVTTLAVQPEEISPFYEKVWVYNEKLM